MAKPKKKVGEKFDISLVDLAGPLVGKLVQITPRGEEQINARVVEVYDSHASVKVVPDKTKE